MEAGRLLGKRAASAPPGVPQEVYELLAAVFGASPVWLAAVGSVVVHAQVPSVPVFHRRRDLVQAGSPHNSLPASRGDLTVAWPAPQQHIHPLEGMWPSGRECAVRALASRVGKAVRQVRPHRLRPLRGPGGSRSPSRVIGAGTGCRWPAAAAAPPARGRGQQPGGGLADWITFVVEPVDAPHCGPELWTTWAAGENALIMVESASAPGMPGCRRACGRGSTSG